VGGISDYLRQGVLYRLEMLKDRRACKPQLDLFIRLGLDGVEVTKELCVRHAQDFNWNRAARKLLRYAAQRSEYYRATTPALVDYLHLVGQAPTPAGVKCR
jgi:hypothetical protein